MAPAAALALSEALDSSADPEGSALTEVALEPRQVWSLTQLCWRFTIKDRCEKFVFKNSGTLICTPGILIHDFFTE